jgi:hypothetical protein
MDFMVHVTCDLCGKQLGAGHGRHIVKIEVFAAHDPAALTEDDLDADHMEALGELLEEMEDGADEELEPTSRQFHFDLCCDCRDRFVESPLAREPAKKLHFSEN